MLVKQLSGSRAGEVVDIPRHLADRLIADGRAQDIRDRSQFGDPDTLNIDHRDYERLTAKQETNATALAPVEPRLEKPNKRRR